MLHNTHTLWTLGLILGLSGAFVQEAEAAALSQLLGIQSIERADYLVDARMTGNSDSYQFGAGEADSMANQSARNGTNGRGYFSLPLQMRQRNAAWGNYSPYFNPFLSPNGDSTAMYQHPRFQYGRQMVSQPLFRSLGFQEFNRPIFGIGNPLNGNGNDGLGNNGFGNPGFGNNGFGNNGFGRPFFASFTNVQIRIQITIITVIVNPRVSPCAV